jgi:hypothetical protein
LSHLKQSGANNGHQKAVVNKLEHLRVHQWVRVYNNGIAELERVEELCQFRYFVYIVGGKAVPLFSLNVQFPWKTGIEATQACGKNLSIENFGIVMTEIIYHFKISTA